MPWGENGALDHAAAILHPRLGAPVFLRPWRAAGKLTMTFPNGNFICSTSVINRRLLVTAAHCVHEYGQGFAGFATEVSFQPGRHGSLLHAGTWTASSLLVPTSYINGTDVCTVSGIVCENDIAVVVLNTGTGTNAGKSIAQVTGQFGVTDNNLPYTNFLEQQAAQITKLGYPGAFDGGLKMIRTDSLGYLEAPNNIILGSNQTGGSSGGPWIVNFGPSPSAPSVPVPSFDNPNRVVGTTSWGFGNVNNLKVTGASKFGHNTAFPASGLTNIRSLTNAACAANAANCN